VKPGAVTKKKIWIDLDNSPHVPFFRPIIDELRKRKYEVLVTARDAYQVRELTEFYGVEARMIGKHYGKHKVWKALGTVWRAVELTSFVRGKKPDLAVCHGSRAMLLTSRMLGIPCMVLIDYEFTAAMPGIKPTWLMVPSVVPTETKELGSRILKYPGIKEDVYLSTFRPDETLRARLGVPLNDLLITIRPPATEAHYHNPEAETLLESALERFVRQPNTTILLLPRNKRQESKLHSKWASAVSSRKIIIPAHAEDGLNLIWHSDFVISGGGTMNREAAAMGVPVYSIFRGTIGAVDRYLAEQGRLVLIETSHDVLAKIEAVRRDRSPRPSANGQSPTLEAVIDAVVSIVENRADPGRTALSPDHSRDNVA
jgi:hypothetical protein